MLMAGAAYAFLSHRAAASGTRDRLSILLAVAPLLAIAFFFAWRSRHRVASIAAWIAVCVALWAASDWLSTHYRWLFLVDHAGVHALLGAAFGRSLQAGREPLVTGFARTVHGTLSPALVAYTRSVTWAWTLYFAAVSTLSVVLFCFAPIAVWSAFGYVFTFPLLVLMFAGEYAVRWYALPAADRAGPLEAIRAYRRSMPGGGTHRS
jgi:uncharacterized membrane protein